MNQIATAGQPTMTSLELVEYINSHRADTPELRHADFLAKVPKVLGGGERNFSSTYFDSQTKERPCYVFPKREACLMAMSYSYDLQAKVFDRMTALEQATLPNFLDPAEAAEAWAYQFRARQALQNQITEQAPKVAFADSVCGAINSVSVGDFAKMVSQDGFIIGQNKLFAWLRDQGYLMRRGNVPYQKYIDCGWFEVIEQEFATPDGIRVNSKTLITGRGQLQIHARLVS